MNNKHEKIWLDAWLAIASASNSVMKDMERGADQCLIAFMERFDTNTNLEIYKRMLNDKNIDILAK
jgi:hypothetical protein